MGILAALLGQNNPLAQYAASNHGMLSQWGAGLAQGTNFGDGLANAARLGPAGIAVDQQYAKDQQDKADRQAAINQSAKDLAKFPDLLNAVNSKAITPADAYSEMWKRTGQGQTAAADPSDVATYKFYANQETQAGRSPKSFADWTAGTRPGIKGSLGPPLSYVDPSNKQLHPIQKFTDGSTIDLTTGQPPDPSLVYDPSAQAQAQAGGQAFGTAQGGMQFNMPAAKQNIDTELANIEAIKNDKSGGLDQKFGNVGGISVMGVGIPNQWTPTLPNTPRAGIEARVSQVVGENFLQAYASLKGAGAITEVEGAKAQDAMARLSAAQSKADFIQALNDLEDVLKVGYARMGTQAGGSFQQNGYAPPALGGGGGGAAAPAAGGGGFKVLSVTP